MGPAAGAERRAARLIVEGACPQGAQGVLTTEYTKYTESRCEKIGRVGGSHCPPHAVGADLRAARLMIEGDCPRGAKIVLTTKYTKYTKVTND